jgi:hypothetical protein
MENTQAEMEKLLNSYADPLLELEKNIKIAENK